LLFFKKQNHSKFRNPNGVNTSAAGIFESLGKVESSSINGRSLLLLFLHAIPTKHSNISLQKCFFAAAPARLA
jgi:hypothetical protein